MLKIISKREYQELKNIERKYRELTGQTITFIVGGRSRRAKLMKLEKEELVRIIFDLLNDCNILSKKLKNKLGE